MSGDLQQALDALLAGAGQPDLKIPGGATPQLFRAIGELLALYAGGTTDLLRTIGEIKNTFRINQTQVQRSDNNPLRWAVTPREAVKRLLASGEFDVHFTRCLSGFQKSYRVNPGGS
jgi:predicted component of type VI protein secretion system